MTDKTNNNHVSAEDITSTKDKFAVMRQNARLLREVGSLKEALEKANTKNDKFMMRFVAIQDRLAKLSDSLSEQEARNKKLEQQLKAQKQKAVISTKPTAMSLSKKAETTLSKLIFKHNRTQSEKSLMKV